MRSITSVRQLLGALAFVANVKRGFGLASTVVWWSEDSSIWLSATHHTPQTTQMLPLSRVLGLSSFPRVAYPTRAFSASAAVWAKKDKKAGKKESKKDARKPSNDDDEEVVVLDPKVIINDLKSKYDDSFNQFSKKLTELKMGKANPSIFDKLEIKIDDSHIATFPEVAMTAVKGSNFLNVTVFDPSHTKKIVSSILEANLNLNPEVDPKNPQLLKIKLPNSTKELKEKQIKAMKELLDQYKSNASLKHSLVAIRSHFMKELKNTEGSKDVIKKITNDIDLTYKNYAEKFQNTLKNIEKSLN